MISMAASQPPLFVCSFLLVPGCDYTNQIPILFIQLLLVMFVSAFENNSVDPATYWCLLDRVVRVWDGIRNTRSRLAASQQDIFVHRASPQQKKVFLLRFKKWLTVELCRNVCQKPCAAS
jgi:hypothetical protein